VRMRGLGLWRRRACATMSAAKRLRRMCRGRAWS
jgi:hypothetical protein